MNSNSSLRSSNANLADYGITDATEHWNLSAEALEAIAIEKGMAERSSQGAIVVNTGEFTGRSPKDRFIVADSITNDSVWWGDINTKIAPENFDRLAVNVSGHLSNREVYVRDVWACADPNYRVAVRVITELPWSSQFVQNMFIEPTEDELKNFEPEWVVLNAPSYKADDPKAYGLRQGNFSILNFTKKLILVGGSGYTGEIKKGMFSALNFILPHERDTLSMHCSANVGKDGDTAIFFGLSGTGKTTLSADPERALIGDDEHGWSNENTVFNFEGGCYAKAIDLSAEKEPDIYEAIRPGAILENVVFKAGTKEVDYTNSSITENTRVSYPIDHIKNIVKPSIGHNPKNIFFLTADAFGVLPPISKLTTGQAMYHFISGYTAKVAGTEMGVTEPQPSFSACFGKAFMPLHPSVYAEMLGKKMQEAGVNVWLINTGWSGGSYGVGDRIKLRFTRAMISAALEGQLDKAEYSEHPIFGLNFPTSCPNVPDEILNPKDTWADKEDYDRVSMDLAHRFNKNFEEFAAGCSNEILAGGPKVTETA
jgi:phosphoenolpyruvate carboxykinase (ATP)